MELGRSGRPMVTAMMMSAGAGAARPTGSSTTDRKICSTDSGAPFTTFVVVTRAREAGRRDADRPARPARAAWVVQRLLAARW